MLQEGSGLPPGAIENIEVVAVFLKMPGHGRSHDPGADPSYFHTMNLLTMTAERDPQT
jgi:hypothetical protein